MLKNLTCLTISSTLILMLIVGITQGAIALRNWDLEEREKSLKSALTTGSSFPQGARFRQVVVFKTAQGKCAAAATDGSTGYFAFQCGPLDQVLVTR
jgi:hypothetical protein